MAQYRFNMREDLPQGFVENKDFPELPATTEYLSQLQGKTYDNLDKFREAVNSYLQYLLDKKVKITDESVRDGIQLFPLVKSENFAVGLLNDCISQECHFGKLEKITLE